MAKSPSSSDRTQLQKIIASMAKDKVEVRIAGVLMANKLLDKSTQQPDMVEEITHSILQRVGEGFIVKMLLTCDDAIATNSKLKHVIRAAGFYFLSRACNSVKCAGLIDAAALIGFYFEKSNFTSGEKSQLLAIAKSVTCVKGQVLGVLSAITLILKLSIKFKTVNALEVLITVSDMMMFIDSARSFAADSSQQRKELGEPEARALRSLLIQGVHGAAPEIVRDGTLCTCLQLLQVSFHTLHPSWTTGSCSSVKTSEEEVADKGESSANSFAVFLCSIIRTEVHSLTEEILCLSSSEYTATLLSGTSDWYPATSTTADDAANRPVSQSMDEAWVKGRTTRCLRMLSCAFSLLDCTVHLLIGDEEVNDRDQSDSDVVEPTDSLDALPVWSALSYTEVIQLQKLFRDIINELFALFKEASQLLGIGKDPLYELLSATVQPTSLSPPQALQRFIHSCLLKVLSRAMHSCRFVVGEDEDLLEGFLACLPHITRCSVIPIPRDVQMDVDTSNDSGSVILQSILTKALCYCPVDTGSEPDSGADTGRNTVQPSASFPPSLSLSLSLCTGAGMSSGLDVVQYCTSMLYAAINAGQLQEASEVLAGREDGLLSRLSSLVLCTCSWLRHHVHSDRPVTTSGIESGSREHIEMDVRVQETVLVAMQGCDVLLFCIVQMEADLKGIAIGEGQAQAWIEVAGIPATHVKRLYSNLRDTRSLLQRGRLHLNVALVCNNSTDRAETVTVEVRDGLNSSFLASVESLVQVLDPLCSSL